MFRAKGSNVAVLGNGARLIKDLAGTRWVHEHLEIWGIHPRDLLVGNPSRGITPVGSTFLHLLVVSPFPYRRGESETLKVMRYLLSERNADPNVKDKNGRTPIVDFIYSAPSWAEDPDFGIDVLKLFLEFGADVNVTFPP